MRSKTGAAIIVAYGVIGVAGTALILVPTHPVMPSAEAAMAADPVDLTSILANCGFEHDHGHSRWRVVRPNAQYVNVIPVNPAVTPASTLDLVPPLTPMGSNLVAPAGDNFCAVSNPDDNDLKGKLMHEAIVYDCPAGTVFNLKVWANRGRLLAGGYWAQSPFFQSSPSHVVVEFWGWGTGSSPTVDHHGDWNRNPSVHITRYFSNWGDGSESDLANIAVWKSEVMEFTTPASLRHVALSISGLNNRHDSYVAFDIEPMAMTVALPTIDELFD